MGKSADIKCRHLHGFSGIFLHAGCNGTSETPAKKCLCTPAPTGEPPAMSCLHHYLSAWGGWLTPPRYSLLKMPSFSAGICRDDTAVAPL